MKAATYLKKNKLPCGKAYGIFLGKDALTRAMQAVKEVSPKPAGPTQLKVCPASIFAITVDGESKFVDEGFVIVLRKYPDMRYPWEYHYAEITS